MKIRFISTSEEFLSPIERVRSSLEAMNLKVTTQVAEASEFLQTSIQSAKEFARDETILIFMCDTSEISDITNIPVNRYAVGGIVVSGEDSARTMKNVLEAGFHDYVPESQLDSELVTSISSLLTKNKPSCITIAVTGTGGGSGASTIASLFASSGSQEFGLKTALIDCDLVFGRQTTDFHYHREESYLENYNSVGKSLEELQSICVNAQQNLDVFAQPYNYELEKLSDFEHGARFINDIKKYYELLVIDVPTRLAGFDQEWFELVDQFVMVSTADLSGIRNCSNLLLWAENLNENISKHVFLNRYNKSKMSITSHDFKKILDIKNLWIVNEDMEFSKYQRRLHLESVKLSKIPKEIKLCLNTFSGFERSKSHTWQTKLFSKFWRK